MITRNIPRTFPNMIFIKEELQFKDIEINEYNFIKPEPESESTIYVYSYPNKKLTNMIKTKATSKMFIHGIECISIIDTTYNMHETVVDKKMNCYQLTSQYIRRIASFDLLSDSGEIIHTFLEKDFISWQMEMIIYMVYQLN